MLHTPATAMTQRAESDDTAPPTRVVSLLFVYEQVAPPRRSSACRPGLFLSALSGSGPRGKSGQTVARTRSLACTEIQKSPLVYSIVG